MSFAKAAKKAHIQERIKSFGFIKEFLVWIYSCEGLIGQITVEMEIDSGSGEEAMAIQLFSFIRLIKC